MISFLITFCSIDPGFIPPCEDDNALSTSNLEDFDNFSKYGDDDAGFTQPEKPFILSEAKEEHGPNTHFNSDDSFDSTTTTSSTNPYDDDYTELRVVEQQIVGNQEY